eukprot:3710832-Pyramimonas_sp.AAC.1
MLGWAKHDLQGEEQNRLPDIVFLQEHRLKGAFRRASARKWCTQRGFKVSVPLADSTGAGPTESSAGCAVLSSFPAHPLNLSLIHI